MRVDRKLLLTIVTLAVFTLLSTPKPVAAQGLTSLKANARGQGTLTVGKEVMKVYTVVVELDEDGTGSIIVVSDFQVFVSCTWSAPAELGKGIDLKITGGATASGATGSGKLMLKPDGKSIAGLTIQGSSNTEKRKIELKFTAE